MEVFMSGELILWEQVSLMLKKAESDDLDKAFSSITDIFDSKSNSARIKRMKATV